MKNYAMGGGIYSTKHTKSMGKNAEVKFENILKNNKIKYDVANKDQEMKEHWDYLIKGNKEVKPGRYEVKSAKAKARGLEKDYNIIYIEFKSVGGNQGWIYGKADFIAFETPEGFLVFPREKLLNYISCIIQYMPISEKSGNIGTLYSRKNRNDLVAIFPRQLLTYGVSHQLITAKN